MLIQGHLVRLMAAPPPALAVAGLINDDAVDPGLEGRLASEVANGAEHTEEDFLGQIQGFVAVTEQVQGQKIDSVLSEKASVKLANEGYDPSLGARPLRRAIQRLIEDELSSDLLSGKFKAGDKIKIDVNSKGEIEFKPVAEKQAKKVAEK